MRILNDFHMTWEGHIHASTIFSNEIHAERDSVVHECMLQIQITTVQAVETN